MLFDSNPQDHADDTDTIRSDDPGKGKLADLPEFSLDGAAGVPDFLPVYYPERVKPKKARDLKRTDDLCGGEKVTDNGGKNKEVHIRGYLLESEKEKFWAVLDSGAEFKMVTMPWSGHVYISDGNLEGPKGLDNTRNEWIYEYTLDVVESQSSHHGDTGIVNKGDQ